ncbi:DUF4291 domain-containing protein [Actinoalloteichus caeruleus]|uniref:DUF4291 domain-containing protein n=1 Tax=Actinoalloteichus cyanogriseus TaxID=2893586 RepID=UPI0006913F4D|nr:DUF4291 domain-containing protein [Actinoalloteichus caeruleus]
MSLRKVRANADASSVVVYQAYPAAIADPALRAGTFVAPFKQERMTWIKPSFRWMMYRCGWATKPGQERVLAVRISLEGLWWALRRSCASSHGGGRHPNREAWRRQLAESPVRVQWDPERDMDLNPLPQRSIQIGLGPEASRRYVDEWIVELTDVTELAREVGRLVRAGDQDGARALLPEEHPLTVPADIAERIDVTGPAPARTNGQGRWDPFR